MLYETSTIKFHTEMIAYLCILGLAWSAALANVDEGAYEDPEWWKQVTPNPNAIPIDQNVTLHAHITYDSAYEKQKMENVGSSANGEEDSTTLKAYFEALLKKVETYFGNHSIIIKVKVSSVSKNTNLSFYNDKVFNARRTLENVIAYGNSIKKSIDTVFYHFTWTETIFDGINSIKPNALSQSAAETHGTFCTTNTSAAVIRHRHRRGIYWSAARSTASIFGSKHLLPMTGEDRKMISEAFSRCPKPTPIPAC